MVKSRIDLVGFRAEFSVKSGALTLPERHPVWVDFKIRGLGEDHVTSRPNFAETSHLISHLTVTFILTFTQFKSYVYSQGLSTFVSVITLCKMAF